MCVLFSSSAVGKTRQRAAIGGPRPGTCPLQGGENRDKRGKEGRQIQRDAERRGKELNEGAGSVRPLEIFQLGSFPSNGLFQSGQMSSAAQPAPVSFDQKATSPS